MDNIAEILQRPAIATTPGKRAAALLGDGETAAFAGISLGDLVYDRVCIDPQALEAFDFVHRANADDIYALAHWSHHIVSEPLPAYEGQINRLQGYVFERMAALSLRQSGAVVEFPGSAQQPGWDFLVNGEPVQVKCGLSPHLVTEHLARYPNVPRVVVNEDLASHFVDNDQITAVPGLTEDTVRSTTEHSLGSSADMLELHLASVVPAISVVRNAYHVLRGNTDLAALFGNVASDAAGRYAGAGTAKALGAGTVALFGLSGWPAVMLPVVTATVGYRGGRALSDRFKREVLLRSEYAQLTEALRAWCAGSARVLAHMIGLVDKNEKRFAAARDGAHAESRALVDDWLNRLTNEQNYRRFHLERFNRGAVNPWVFEDGSGPLGACAAAMVAASRVGILPADLAPQRRLLIARIGDYAAGLRRRLLHR